MMATKDTLARETAQKAHALHSVVNFFVRRKFSRLVLEHDRNIVLNRECEAIGLADKLGSRLAVYERPLAYRTYENIKQACVHGYVAK